MKSTIFAFGLLCIFFTTQLSFAQTDRGAGNIKVKADNGQTKEIKIYDGSYALVIGESDYANGWDKLPGVKTDVAEVRSALERQGFKVETEINLTADNFKSRVDRFIGDYGYGANNRLLIYFAGHGHTQKSNDGRDLGYIIPVDAPLPEKDDIGFRRKAVSMDAIQAFARQIEAKHALFIFDSCFSGKLISRDKITIPPVIQENVAYAVRQFITAGAANQSVPDESIFRKAFVRGIDGEADRNADGYITGSELADYLKEKVTNASDRTQTPQYGKIRDIDLDRGDFVFIKSNENNSKISDYTAAIAADSNEQRRLSALESVEKQDAANSQFPRTRLGEDPNPYFYSMMVDNSGGFRSIFQKVLEANKVFVNDKRPQDEFEILRFVSSDKLERVQEFTANKTLLVDAIDNLYIEGGLSALLDAIYVTTERIEDVVKQRNLNAKNCVILLLTDGEDRDSYYKESQVLEKLRKSGIRLYIIGYVNELAKTNKEKSNKQAKTQLEATEFLIRLSTEANGQTFFAKSPEDIIRVANQINTLLHAINK